MPNVEYSIEHELTDLVESMLDNTRLAGMGELREHQIKIVGVFSIRTNDQGDSLPPSKTPVKLKKIPDEMRPLLKDKARYVLIVDYSTWEGWDDLRRQAHIYNVLASISVEKSKTGIKVRTVKPDVVEHSATIAHFGLYNPAAERFMEAERNRSLRVITALVDNEQARHDAEEASENPDEDSSENQPDYSAEETEESERPRIRTADEEFEENPGEDSPVQKPQRVPRKK